MTIRIYTRSILIIALISMAFGGEFLHLRVHLFTQNPSNFLPFISGLLSILVVPALFLFKKTIGYGYVLNGMLAILGTIGMSYFSIAHWPEPFTLGSIFFKTTLADICLLWGKFFVGKALFDLEMFGYDRERIKMGVTYRYPNLGWWLVHLAAISLIFFLGHGLWR
jgi:hypothetical protein